VHTFDPSDDSRVANRQGEDYSPLIFHHYVGLSEKSSMLQNGDHISSDVGDGGDVEVMQQQSMADGGQYGRLGGGFMTLSAAMEVLGHGDPFTTSHDTSETEPRIEHISQKYINHRRSLFGKARRKKLRVLKIDCEGCEWAALHQVATESPALLDHVCTIVIELHLATTLKVATIKDLQLVASFFELYIVQMGFRVQTVHPNPGVLHDRYMVHPLLVALGLEAGVCCYDLVLHRNDCA
jgi:hypothetical protein